MKLAHCAGKWVRQSPAFLISLLVHANLFLALAYGNWVMTAPKPIEENPSITIVPEGEAGEQMQFGNADKLDEFRLQGADMFDEFKAPEKPDSLPKIETYAVMPEAAHIQNITVREDMDSIGTAAVFDRAMLSVSSAPAGAIGGGLTLFGGGEKFSGSFSRHVQGMRDVGLDVVFLFDATSSMAEILRQVKLKITYLAATFKLLVPAARIGVVAYRDIGENFVTKVLPLTHVTQKIESFLRGIDPVGGGDWEEAVDAAFKVAVNELDWNRNSKKIILLIGDAPPHRQDVAATEALVEKFRNQMGGTVSALDTAAQSLKAPDGRTSRAVLEEFTRLAQIGGGESARLEDEEKVIRQMVVLVFGSKWATYLDEFMKNLL